MIVVDSSAALAVIFEEARAEEVINALLRHPSRIMSPANVLECVLRLAPHVNQDRSAQIDAFVETLGIATVSIDDAQLTLAREAFIAYGKGRHPAGLNFGDCFAYALAKYRDAPLLFIGNDFSKTDLKSVL